MITSTLAKGIKPRDVIAPVAIVAETLSLGFDDLDARLARLGYSAKTLAEQFDARPAEINRSSRHQACPLNFPDRSRS